jgi:hypothetical protein
MMMAASFAGVSISSPSSGSTVTSPVKFVASGSIGGTVTAMQIYDNGSLKYQVKASSINTSLAMAAGTHSIAIKIWNSAGQNVMTSETIKVSGTSSTSGTTSVPSGAKVYSNIDQMSGWANCGACAGAGGNGSVVPFSQSQYQSSPSMDGSSSLFWIGGGTPYSDALWWKQLGANSAVSHFVYDTYFYYQNTAAPQALEFDLNQSVGGHKYIFGTQCNIRGDHAWDVWDNINARWVSTGIGCSAPPAYTWNHLVWEFERVNGQLHFIAVTLNGVKHYVNRYYWPRSSGASELNVAFQMDGNYAQTSYKVWLDKTTLKAW